jgi:TrmH family RNA methyltransferase
MAIRDEMERLRVVLVGARNPLNIGAAARAMSNFGFMNMRVVNPFKVAFREAKSAVGASELLAKAEEFESVAEAVADCTLVVGTTAVGKRELQHPLRALEAGARLMRKRMGASNVALLFGSEKIGLTNEELSHCHWLMRIPTRLEHRSMNLGQAVAICLYEIARDTKAGSLDGKKKVATSGDVERIAAVLLEALEGSLYSRPGASRATEEKLRRMLRRMELSPADAAVMLGMMRQILWKLKNGPAKQP